MSNNALSAEQFGGGFFAQAKPKPEPEVLGQGKARAVESEWGKPETPGRFTQYGE